MLLAILGTLAIVGAFVAVGLWVDRKVGILPRPEELGAAGQKPLPDRRHEAGLAPSTALHIDAAQQQRVIARQRCTCGPSMEAAPPDEIRFGDKRLIGVKLTCPTCGASRSLYFDPR